MSTLHYLAYGSNLHPLRLERRVPQATLLGTAELESYRISFSKVGSDRSGKCTIHAASGQRIFGAVYRVSQACRRRLDSIEGGYRRVAVEVSFVGERHPVFTYVARQALTRASMIPYDWYRDLVVAGARFHGFPEPYVRMLEAVETVPDPDAKRRRTHTALVAELAP